MSSYLKYVLVATALLFSAAGLCGDPNWPVPPKAQEVLQGNPDWPVPPKVL